jgi:hypothetical protein
MACLRHCFAPCVLCLVVLLCGCEDESVFPGPGGKCGVYTVTPPTCYTDSIDFGSVAVGDTAQTYFVINNCPFADPRLNLCSALTAQISQSTCGDFTWESGVWTLEPGDVEHIWVRFHPSSVGGHRCDVAVTPAGCENIRLKGSGISKPSNTLIRLCSFLDVDVRFCVSYDQSGVRDTLEQFLGPWVDLFSSNCTNIYVPDDATALETVAEVATGSDPDPWSTLFREAFPQPVRTCYRLWSGSWLAECDTTYCWDHEARCRRNVYDECWPVP